MTAGQLLRVTRRKHGVTQRQLAIRARTSQAAISRIERDLVSPSVSTLGGLLRLMNEELVLEAREVDWGHDVVVAARRDGGDLRRAPPAERRRVSRRGFAFPNPEDPADRPAEGR